MNVELLKMMMDAHKKLLDESYDEKRYEDMMRHCEIIMQTNSLLTKYSLSSRRS